MKAAGNEKILYVVYVQVAHMLCSFLVILIILSLYEAHIRIEINVADDKPEYKMG